MMRIPMARKTRHIIEVTDLVKRYAKSETNAVDSVSFYVEEGAFFSLLGPNGAGKTTTISILTTILSMTSGRATIAGFDVARDAAKVRETIGVIFQNPSLDVNLTAEENIRFHANLYGLFPYRPSFSMMDDAYREKVKELSFVLGLERDIFKPVKSLSGGMKRKLEIIRSLMHRPKVLFLDEPTTGLDPISRSNLWEYLQDIRKKEKTTIFLTTHYLEEAEGSDYLCIINNGRIEAKGTPGEIKKVLIEKYISADAHDRNTLMKELLSKRIRFSGKGPFRIDLDGKTSHQLIRAIDTPLIDLRIYNPTLEEAYVAIIGQNDGGLS
jgi:ABC-2 type transport system ATP-binding protein